MPREGTSLEASWLAELIGPLTQAKHETLHRSLYWRLRTLLVEGTLAAGQAMPASRTLATQLAVSRNTVLAAYDQLIAEGFLETRAGAGTYAAAVASNRPGTIQHDAHPGLSTRGLQLFAKHGGQREAQTGAFVPGVSALDAFPLSLWQRYQSRYLSHPKREWLGYTQDGGLAALRTALAEHLTQARGVRASADTILITHGAQQALELVARLLANAGDTAWIEDPGYSGAQAALAGAGLNLCPVPVDDQGLAPSLAPVDSVPRLIYVTPSHQYPSGVVMSLTRRRELLATAEAHNAWIIEDDYDSEFRYRSEPIAALQGLSDSSRVIYLGTFSKSLYPGLRLAYLVLPEQLVDAFRATHNRFYREGHYPLQAALADFITDGQFARHIRKMRALYRQRQALLREVLASELGASLPLSPGEAGLHLVAHLPKGFATTELVDTARQQNIWLRDIARHYLGEPQHAGLVLGYAGVPEAEIESAGATLGRLLAQRM